MPRAARTSPAGDVYLSAGLYCKQHNKYMHNTYIQEYVVYKELIFTDVSEERDPTLLDGFDPDGKLAYSYS